jgi:hypothetical protein
MLRARTNTQKEGRGTTPGTETQEAGGKHGSGELTFINVRAA